MYLNQCVEHMKVNRWIKIACGSCFLMIGGCKT